MKIESNKHYLFIGDNLPILSELDVLDYFDVCYIDPPYNTKKMMGYNDNFSSHEKWVEFMKVRLEKAIPMLNKNGLMFISVGEEELAHLIILCNKLFKECNFVSLITWQSKYTVSNDKNGICSQTEYILVYAVDKNRATINKDDLRQEYINRTYKNPDNDPRGPWRGGVQLYKNKNKNSFTVVSPTGKKWTKPWNYSEKNWYLNLEKNNLIYWGENGDKCPVKKVFLQDTKKAGRSVTNLWLGNDVGYTSTGTKDLEAFVGDNRNFFYPKPVSLIKRILKISGKTDSRILDFFAGTGTTAQAVLELNKIDGGNRQAVLITNNENNIANDITVPRLNKVINGYVHAKSKKVIEGTKGILEIKEIHNDT